jgi:hypothetical protein
MTFFSSGYLYYPPDTKEQKHISAKVYMKNAYEKRYVCQYFLSIVYSGILAFIFSSCVSSTSFIQSASIRGPAQKYMVRITENTEDEKFTLRCQYSQNMEQEIRTSASDVNYITSGENSLPDVDLYDNVFWQLPSSEFLIDMEIPLSSVMVIFGGLNVGMFENKTSLGKAIGLGFRREAGNVNARLDISYNIQDMSYQVIYGNETDWIWGETTESTIYDQGTLTSTNIGLGITMNAAKPDWIVNPFIHGAIGSQTIIKPKETEFFPDPPSYSDSYLNLACGVFVCLGNKHRLVTGFGWNKHSNESGKSPWVSNLLIQFDLVY